MARDLNGGLLAGALAVIGHCYSAWLLGRGGKGLAPAVGVLFAVKLPLLLAGLVLVALAYLLTRSPYRAVLL
ncbi:glycerol-3-phosphate acyltransferase, partial [Escherichia coli]|nr:glycerol-3-phosphate acyltransferase [Escherichia coli]